MSELDKLLKDYAPPPVPLGLAQRAATEAAKHAQETAKTPPRRRDRRGGWKRPLWIGTATFGLILTSAVAATVVSGGRIEIPVVQQVVEAIPVLDRATKRNEPEQRIAEAAPPKASEHAIDQPAEAGVAMPQPGAPGWRKAQVMQTLARSKKQVEARRAAGLPTPRADRIEHRAKQLVERRQAAGLPTPTVEEVEAGLALRELRGMWLMRRAGQWDPSMLTDAQLARIAGRLPPEKRERFLALPPDMQRQLVARQIEQSRARWAKRRAGSEATNVAPAEPAQAAPDETVEPIR